MMEYPTTFYFVLTFFVCVASTDLASTDPSETIRAKVYKDDTFWNDWRLWGALIGLLAPFFDGDTQALLLAFSTGLIASYGSTEVLRYHAMQRIKKTIEAQQEEKKPMPTTFREQLIHLNACEEARQWVGNRTLPKAWNECPRPDWLAWIAGMAFTHSHPPNTEDKNPLHAVVATLIERYFHVWSDYFPNDPALRAAFDTTRGQATPNAHLNAIGIARRCAGRCSEGTTRYHIATAVLEYAKANFYQHGNTPDNAAHCYSFAVFALHQIECSENEGRTFPKEPLADVVRQLLPLPILTPNPRP